MKSTQNKKQVTIDKQPKKHEYVDVLENVIKNKSLYFLFIPVVLLLLFVYRDFISLRHYFIFRDIGSDTITYNYPHFVCISEYFKHFGIPSWSFQQGLGQNIFPLSLGDPFTDLLYFADKTNIPKYIVYIELLKISLIALFSFLLLRKLNLSRFVSITGACMLAFSGFVILGGTWYIFSIDALYFIIFIYGFECLYQGDKWYIFPLAIFLVTANVPPNLFIYFCFLIIYALFRFISDDTFSFVKIAKLSVQVIVLGIIGIALSAALSFPTIYQILHSPRVGGNVSLFHTLFSFGLNFESKTHYGTALMRLFSSDILGSGIQFSGWGNYLEAPLFYCSLPLLLLVPQVFTGTSNKMKIIYGSLIAFMFLTVLFPFLRYAFWLFSGDYFRFYSFGIIFLFLILALKALHSISKSGNVNLITLGVSTVVILFALQSASSFKLEVIETTKKAVSIFIIIYALYILMMKYERTRMAGQILLFVTLFFELGYMASKTVNDRTSVLASEMTQKIGYNDYSVEAIDYIKAKDNGFYRINKNYLPDVALHMALNDAKVLNYHGGTNYASFNQLQYIHFFQETEAIKNASETDSRWCIGYLNRPLLQLLCNVKYIVTKAQIDPLVRIMNDSLTTFEDVTVRKSKFFMPLGITYDTYIPVTEFRKLKAIGKDIALLKCFINDSIHPLNLSGLKEMKSNDINLNYDFNMLQQDVSNRKADTLKITSFKDTHITGTISLPSKKLLFLAIPNDEGWRATIDGKIQATTTVSAGMMGFMLEKGNHNIVLEYVRPYFNMGVIVSLCSIVIFMGILVFFTLKKRKTNSI